MSNNFQLITIGDTEYAIVDSIQNLRAEDSPHCQNSCHPYLNNLNGGKGDNHGTIQSRTQTSNIKQTAIA